MASLRAGQPASVFYVLPTIADMRELESSSPDYRNRTLLLEPIWIGVINDRRVHRIYVNAPLRTCTVHSDIFKGGIQLLEWSKVVKVLRTRDIGIRVSDFVERLAKESSKEKDIDIYIKGDSYRRIYVRGLIIPEPT